VRQHGERIFLIVLIGMVNFPLMAATSTTRTLQSTCQTEFDIDGNFRVLGILKGLGDNGLDAMISTARKARAERVQ